MAEPYDTAPTVEAIADEIIAGDRTLRAGRTERAATVAVVAVVAERDGVLDALVAGGPLADGAEAEMVGAARAQLAPESMPPEALVDHVIKSVRRMVRRPPGE
jgi:hypothetical protein